MGSREHGRRTRGNAGRADAASLPEQHGRDPRLRVHGRGSRRAGQPGRRPGGRCGHRPRAFLHRRLRGRRPRGDRRARHPDRDPDVEAAGPFRSRCGEARVRLRGGTLLRNAAIAAVLVVLLAVGLFELDSLNAFVVYQLSSVTYVAIAAAGLTLLTGLNGQLSLGHGALMGIGAYCTAVLLRSYTDLNPAAVMAAAVLTTAAVSVVVGLGAARLRGPYLAGATLGLAV